MNNQLKSATGILVAIGIVAAFFLLVANLAAQEKAPTQTVELRDKIYDVKFVSDREAWAIGYPGLLLHTTDAGETWERMTGITDQALFALDFVGGTHGWIVGRGGSLLTTTDGGKTWQAKTPICTEPLFDVDFVDQTHGVAVGYFGQIWTTIDGGQSWTKHVIELMNNASLNAVCMISPTEAWIAGEAPLFELQYNDKLTSAQITNLYHTTDGGQTWQIARSGTNYTLYDIYFRDAQRGWAAGARGALIATEDGGKTWRNIPTGVNGLLLKIGPAKDALWIVGTEGLVLKIVDQKTQLVDLKAYTWLDAINFSSAGHGLIVGGRGSIFSTPDGGNSWKKFPVKR